MGIHFNIKSTADFLKWHGLRICNIIFLVLQLFAPIASHIYSVWHFQFPPDTCVHYYSPAQNLLMGRRLVLSLVWGTKWEANFSLTAGFRRAELFILLLGFLDYLPLVVKDPMSWARGCKWSEISIQIQMHTLVTVKTHILIKTIHFVVT